MAALDYAACGLRVIPTGGDDGKRPLVKWRGFQRGQSIHTVTKLVQRFPTANIGVLDGHKGGISRIDIDDPALVDGAIRRFGDTP